MPTLASLFAAVVPMFIYLLVIWRFDKYDREPFGLVLRNYLWGAVGAIFFAMVGSWIVSGIVSLFVPNKAELNHIETIFVAPFVEEITKGLFLFITVADRRFDNITDGIVYGGAIGLGFGMTENFLYFIAYSSSVSEWISIVIIRTLFSAVMHCVSTATLGAFIGYAKFKGIAYRIFFPIIGLGVAMFIHFAWNFSVSFESTALLGFLFMIITIAVFFITFYLAVLGERKIIYQELLEEAEIGILPASHIAILNSPKRKHIGWVDERIRKLYINAATTLAFRKMELKHSKGSSRDYYERDVEYYRSFIHNLLSNVQLK